MHCKSLWIKASAKCINVNVNYQYTYEFTFSIVAVQTKNIGVTSYVLKVYYCYT